MRRRFPWSERSFCSSPTAFKGGWWGGFCSRFEDKGFNIIAMKLMQVTPELAKKHYAEHVQKSWYPALEAFITGGPIVAAVIEGLEAIRVVRDMVGATNGLKAAPGTIRGDFSSSRQMNLVHASDGPESAEREIGIYFHPRKSTVTGRFCSPGCKLPTRSRGITTFRCIFVGQEEVFPQREVAANMKITLLRSLPWIAALASLLLPVAVASPAVAREARPNVLLIILEDWGPYLGCYGETEMHTPHLDHLAAEGRRDNNCFTSAPVCSTGCSSLMTGMSRIPPVANSIARPTSGRCRRV